MVVVKGLPQSTKSRRLTTFGGRTGRFQVLLLALTIVTLLGSFWYQTQLSQQQIVRKIEAYQGPLELLHVYFQRQSRPPLTRDEFFQKPLSQAELDAYFAFDYPSTPTVEMGMVEALWTCSDIKRHTKLAYVQVARTGGSTIRAFLRGYSDFCHAGIAVLTNCIDLGLEYMEGDDIWANGRTSHRAVQDCQLSFAANRTDPLDHTGKVSTSFLEQHDIDIVAGHLPIGANEFWTDREGQSVDLRYIVFFREPLSKYVSEILFLHRFKHLSIQDAVALINQTAFQDLKKGNYHEKYSNYLISPDQKEWAAKEGVEWNAERRVNLTLSNIVQNQAVIGLIERIPESFQLLQYVLDREREISKLFEFFSSKEKVDKVAQIYSNSMTNDVLAEIHKDQDMTAMLKELLKYESRIYEYAMQLHNQQYAWLSNTWP